MLKELLIAEPVSINGLAHWEKLQQYAGSGFGSVRIRIDLLYLIRIRIDSLYLIWIRIDSLNLIRIRNGNMVRIQ